MSSPAKYSKPQIALHWGMALLFFVSFVSHEGMKDAWRALVRTGEPAMSVGAAVHVWVGVLLLGLVAVRIVTRLLKGAPKAVETGNKLLDLSAKIAHLALYGVMILVPLSGALAWFGGVRDASEVHEVMFTVGLALVGLHIVAALYHQFILKDGLMQRMR